MHHASQFLNRLHRKKASSKEFKTVLQRITNSKPTPAETYRLVDALPLPADKQVPYPSNFKPPQLQDPPKTNFPPPSQQLLFKHPAKLYHTCCQAAGRTPFAAEAIPTPSKTESSLQALTRFQPGPFSPYMPYHVHCHTSLLGYL